MLVLLFTSFLAPHQEFLPTFLVIREERKKREKEEERKEEGRVKKDGESKELERQRVNGKERERERGREGRRRRKRQECKLKLARLHNSILYAILSIDNARSCIIHFLLSAANTDKERGRFARLPSNMQ